MGFENLESNKAINKKEFPPSLINPEKPSFSFTEEEIEKARRQGGEQAVEALMKKSGQVNERLKQVAAEKAEEEKKKEGEKRKIFNVQDMKMQ
jgi:hypothetical protein